MRRVFWDQVQVVVVVHRVTKSAPEGRGLFKLMLRYKAGLFFGHSKKNSRCKKLKTQEKNSKLKLKIQTFGTFEEK